MKQLLFLAMFLVLASSALAENQVDAYFFYGQGCPHCAQMEPFLEQIVKENPSVNLMKYEVYFNNDNRQLFQRLADAYNTEIQGVPTTFVDKKVFVGFSDSIGNEVKKEILRCLKENCTSPAKILAGENGKEKQTFIGDKSPEKIDVWKELTFPAVISAAFVDSINPCEFAVLIILLTAILASSNRRRALFAGLAFSLAIFISYFLMGLGLYSAIEASGLTRLFYVMVGILAILVGLFNLKDYFWYGKWFIMEVPLSWRPRMKMLIKSVTSPFGAFLIGFVVSLFLLPCTSGPYIVILGLLAHTTTKATALGWLILYNIIFVSPMLIITLLVSMGITTTEQAEEWRQKKLKILHLITGIIILLLGIGMLAALAFGML